MTLTMLSRIAENLFWMGRLIERAEGIARALTVQYFSTLEENINPTWEPILNSVGQLEPFFEIQDLASPANVIEYLIFSETNPSSVFQCISKARENARGVREMISKETWEILNVTFHEIENYSREKKEQIKNKPDGLFLFLKERSFLFQGVTDNTMFRGTGFHFLEAGKFIERADQTARILDVKYHIPLKRIEDVGNPVDIFQWKALLDSIGAYEAYLKCYGTKILPIQVAELLIFNKEMPRSLIFCMDKALISVREISQEISREKGSMYMNRAEQKLGKLYYQLAYSNIEEIFFFGLHEYLTNYINDLIGLGSQMNYTFFGYSY